MKSALRRSFSRGIPNPRSLAAITLLVVCSFNSVRAQEPTIYRKGPGPIISCKGPSPTAIDTSTCNQAEALSESWTSNLGLFGPAYDTIRYFIEHCYAIAVPGRAFSDLANCYGQGAAPQLQTSEGRLELRNWLLQTVIPLRGDDPWFCSSVWALAGSYKPGDWAPLRTIFKFLIDNPRCLSDRASWAHEYDNASDRQWNTFRDTMHNAEKYDSTLPSLHELGLESLLKGAAAGVQYESLGPQIIADAQVLANPFRDETSLSLTINREAYLHIELYDLLGRRIEKDGYEGVFESGQRVVPLGLALQPPGTYCLRISTSNNEVRTIRLVKE